jgi:hypothetical protein
MVADPHASYRDYYDLWKKDFDYAQQLLPGAIDGEDLVHVESSYAGMNHIDRLYRSWGMIIKVITLGLYVLWEQPLYRS